MQMIKTAGTLDWSGWLRGVIGAFISGGAASVGAGFAAMKLDTAHDLNIFALMAVTFLFSGLISLMKFLQITPVPGPEAVKPN